MRDPLIRAWMWLIGLSLLSTALALWSGAGLSPMAARGAALVIVAVAFMKGRVILRSYLGLASSARLSAGFTGALAVMCLIFAALYLAA